MKKGKYAEVGESGQTDMRNELNDSLKQMKITELKSVASLLSRFESYYFHHTADNVMAACRKCTLVVQVRLLVRWSKKSEW